MKTFLRSERGNISIEWVLIAALATVGGMSLASATEQAVQTSGAQVQSNLWDDEFFVPEFLNFIASGVYQPGESFGDASNTTAVSVTMNVSLDPADTGILFEAGGLTHGIVMYQYNGMLYLQVGEGGTAGGDTDTGEIAYAVTGNEQTIQFSAIASNQPPDNGLGSLVLYVDGTIVGTATFDRDQLTGGSWGAVGGAAGTVAANRGGFTAGDGHPGAIDAIVYNNQITSDV